MPALKLKAFEVSELTLDLIKEELGLSEYQIMEEMEQAARKRLAELRKEAEESAKDD